MSRNFVNDLRAGLRKYRDRTGLSQEAVGKRLDIQRSTLTNFELGRTILREEDLVKVYNLVKSSGAVLADELRDLADFLDLPDVSNDVKAERFLNRLLDFQRSMEAYFPGAKEIRHD